MLSRLSGFIDLLRSHGLPISPAETVDAANVAATLGYANRQHLREGLAMSLAKTREEERILLQCFDQYFTRQLSDFTPAEAVPEEDSAAGGQQNTAAQDSEALRVAAHDEPALAPLLQSRLVQQLLNKQHSELAIAIEKAGAAVGLDSIQHFTQRGQYSRRILDALGEQALRKALLALEDSDEVIVTRLRKYRDNLRQQVRGHVDKQYLLLSEGRNQQLTEQRLSRLRLSELENHYLQQVQTMIHNMARKLVDQHSRPPRQAKRGGLDMARTLRRGIPNNGLMFNTYWRRKVKNTAQILALCDVSGSVAAYAKFLLLLLYSLQDILPKVRSFAFSNHLGEVSQLFREHPVEQAIELAQRYYGGATDYGKSLVDFAQVALPDIQRSTTVIILGDARNNGGDPRLDILQSIYQRSRRVIWLNPESRSAWGTGDSEMPRYQNACHLVAECNNLQQLERIVDQILRHN